MTGRLHRYDRSVAYSKWSAPLQLSREDRIKHREQRQVHDALLKEQNAYREASGWRDSLSRGLESLKVISQHGVALEIIEHTTMRTPSECGRKALQRLLGYEVGLFAEGLGKHREVAAILKEALTSACAFTELKLAQHYISIEPLEFCRAALGANAHVASTLGSLHTLELSLYLYEGVQVLDTLAEALAVMPSLTQLKIKGSGASISAQSTADSFGRFSTTAFIARLQKFDIDMPWLTPANLARFVKKHQETLQLISVHAYWLIGFLWYVEKEVEKRIRTDSGSMHLTVQKVMS